MWSGATIRVTDHVEAHAPPISGLPEIGQLNMPKSAIADLGGSRDYITMTFAPTCTRL